MLAVLIHYLTKIAIVSHYYQKTKPYPHSVFKSIYYTILYRRLIYPPPSYRQSTISRLSEFFGNLLWKYDRAVTRSTVCKLLRKKKRMVWTTHIIHFFCVWTKIVMSRADCSQGILTIQNCFLDGWTRLRGTQKVPPLAPRHFSSVFHMAENANIARTLRYLRARHITIAFYKPNEKVSNDLTMARASQLGTIRRISETTSDRSQKRAAWVYRLYGNLFGECDRLQKCDVKFNASILLLVARTLIGSSTVGSYGPSVRDPISKNILTDYLNNKWVERLCQIIALCRKYNRVN